MGQAGFYKAGDDDPLVFSEASQRPSFTMEVLVVFFNQQTTLLGNHKN